MDLYNEAIENGCDCFVTGDLKYHSAVDSQIVIYDAGHFETEILIKKVFQGLIKEKVEVYLANEKSEHSRHLYDLYKIKNYIVFNDDFYRLFNEVKNERKIHEKCLSAMDNVSLPEVLKEILEKDYYKSDYEDITCNLLFEKVDYKTVKDSLASIIEIFK